MIMRLKLDLPEDLSFTVLARHLSRTLLEHLEVTVQDVDDIEYVIGELANNAVKHAGDAVFTLELEFYADRAVMSVQDRGKGFTFAEVPPPGTARTDTDGQERVGGWGIPLIMSLADHVQFFRGDPHGTTVRAEKALHYRSPAAAIRAEDIDDSLRDSPDNTPLNKAA
jgi:anti-sigma regulatory factor (Ser/Thr protein kinase)